MKMPVKGSTSSGSMLWPAFRSCCKARGQGDQSLAKVSSDHPNSLSLDTYGGLSVWSYGGRILSSHKVILLIIIPIPKDHRHLQAIRLDNCNSQLSVLFTSRLWLVNIVI